MRSIIKQVDGRGRILANVDADARFRVEFNPNPVVTLDKVIADRRLPDGSIKPSHKEKRQFMIEYVDFSISLGRLETLQDDLSKDDLTRYVNMMGRWALKSGGWASKVEFFSDFDLTTLDTNTLNFVHSAVGFGLDEGLEAYKALYEVYSKIINQLLQLPK